MFGGTFHSDYQAGFFVTFKQLSDGVVFPFLRCVVFGFFAGQDQLQKKLEAGTSG
jgi:hypothetical protein